MPVAETCDIVFIAAEVLAFGCSMRRVSLPLCGIFTFQEKNLTRTLEWRLLELVRTKLLVDDLPDNLVGRHFVKIEPQRPWQRYAVELEL